MECMKKFRIESELQNFHIHTLLVHGLAQGFSNFFVLRPDLILTKVFLLYPTHSWMA